MPPTPPPPPPPSHSVSEAERPADVDRSSLPWLCLSLAVTLLVAVVCGFLWLHANPHQSWESRGEGPVTQADIPLEISDSLPEFLTARHEASVAEPAPELDPPAGSDEPLVSVAPVPIAAVTTPQSASSIFDDLRRRGFHLELPRRDRDIVRQPEEVKLADLQLPSETPLHLALLNEAESGIRLISTDAIDEWGVQKLARSSLGTQDTEIIARFTHRNGELRFQWTSSADWTKPESLRFSPLQLQAGDQRLVCSLCKPVVASPLRIAAMQPTAALDLPIAGGWLDPPQRFRASIQLTGLDATYAVKQPATCGLDDVAIVRVEDNAGHAVEIELTMQMTAAHTGLHLEFFSSLPGVGPSGARREVSIPIAEQIQKSLSHKPTAARKKSKSAAKKGDAEKPPPNDPVTELDEAITEAEQRIETLNNEVEQTTADVKRVVQSSFKNAYLAKLNEQVLERDQWIARRETLLKQRDIKIKQQDKAQAAQDLSDKKAAWCAGVLAILNALQDRGRLHYTITATGQPSVLVITTQGAP